VSDIEDESLLDIDTAEVPSNNAETPNTFGKSLLRRLGVPHGHKEAEAASTSPSSDNTLQQITTQVHVCTADYLHTECIQ